VLNTQKKLIRTQKSRLMVKKLKMVLGIMVIKQIREMINLKQNGYKKEINGSIKLVKINTLKVGNK